MSAPRYVFDENFFGYRPACEQLIARAQHLCRGPKTAVKNRAKSLKGLEAELDALLP